ncbi:MAG: sensor histidine kinase [Chitinophagales bacterium]
MKYLTLLFFVFSTVHTTFAQTNPAIDSINDIATSLAETDAIKAKQLAYHAIDLSNQQHYKYGIAKAYNCIGIVYDVAGNYDSSMYYYNKGLQLAKAIDNKKLMASITNNIGMIDWNKGNFDIALTKYFESLKLFEAINYEKGQANTLSNIGLIYADINKNKEAMEYCMAALKIREKIKDDYGLSVSYTNLATLYSRQDHIEKSIEYNQKSNDIKRKIDDEYGIAINLNNMASEYSKLNDKDKALELNFEAEKIRIKIDDQFGLCTTYEAIGHIYIDQQKYTLAIEYLKKAETIALQLDSKSKLKDIYYALAESYKKINNYEQSVHYLELHTELKDSIFTKESNEEFAKLHIQYDTEKKTKEIAQQKLKISTRNFLLVGLAALFLITSLLFYLVYTRNKNKQERKLQAELFAEQEKRAKAILESEENERQRLARELHDGVGQLLTATKLNLANAKNTAYPMVSIENSMQILDESIQEIRNLSHNMVPDILQKFGLEKAIEDFIQKIQQPNTKITFESHNYNNTAFDETEQLMLYRIVQESVNNAIKYAAASMIHVQLSADEKELTLLIEDNGKGFDVKEMQQNKGIGLKNLELRSTYLKGHCTIDSSPGNGTTIIIDVPV